MGAKKRPSRQRSAWIDSGGDCPKVAVTHSDKIKHKNFCAIFDLVTYCGIRFNILSREFRSHFRKRIGRKVSQNGGVL